MSSLLKGNSEVNRKRKNKEKESCIKRHYLKQQRWKDTSPGQREKFNYNFFFLNYSIKP